MSKYDFYSPPILCIAENDIMDRRGITINSCFIYLHPQGTQWNGLVNLNVLFRLLISVSVSYSNNVVTQILRTLTARDVNFIKIVWMVVSEFDGGL